MTTPPTRSPFEPQPPADEELISAYLDDALRTADRAAFEQRLAAEANLRALYDAYHETRAILRAAPEVALPRSFLLNPAEFRRVTPWWARYEALRLMSTVGAAAAVLLITVGVLLSGTPSAPSPMPSSAGVALLATETPLETVTTTRAESVETAEGVGEMLLESTAATPAGNIVGIPPSMPTVLPSMPPLATMPPFPSPTGQSNVGRSGIFDGTASPFPLPTTTMLLKASEESLPPAPGYSATTMGYAYPTETYEGIDFSFKSPTPAATFTKTAAPPSGGNLSAITNTPPLTITSPARLMHTATPTINPGGAAFADPSLESPAAPMMGAAGGAAEDSTDESETPPSPSLQGDRTTPAADLMAQETATLGIEREATEAAAPADLTTPVGDDKGRVTRREVEVNIGARLLIVGGISVGILSLTVLLILIGRRR
ncbi:MAG TPA: hypothetical protein PLD47_12560 [Aggregatilineales bacterium]|nr:hypothetical protein [Anaerolineales bacterium]HRE48549.1 hypothetical protein [Aggregatilineales bacterium]